jgi:hypothetical protein
MLKLASILMIVGVLSNLKSFSQTDTSEPVVRVVRHKAIQVAADLTRYDSLKVKYELLADNVRLLNGVIVEMKEKQENAKQTEGRLNTVISNYGVLNQMQVDRYNDLQKKYKRQVRLGRFEVVLIGAAVTYALFQTLRR